MFTGKGGKYVKECGTGRKRGKFLWEKEEAMEEQETSWKSYDRKEKNI